MSREFPIEEIIEDLKWQLTFAPDEFDWDYFIETAERAREESKRSKEKTEKVAIERGMERETDLSQNCTHCPECGCPWFGNKNLCEEGHRTCFNCYQEWYTHIDYGQCAPLKELPLGEDDE